MRAILCTPVLLAILFASPLASADCIDGMRDTTAAETQYFNRVATALKAALPAAPAGWTLGKVEGSNVGGLCKDTREGDFDILVTGNYTYRPAKEESDRLYAEHRKVQAEIDALQQLPPAVAKERQVWLDKMSEANRAANRAGKEGNKQLSRQLSDEADGYSMKGREIRNQYLASVQSQIAQLEAKQKTLSYRDVGVVVRMVANERYARKSDAASPSGFTVGKAPIPKSTGLAVYRIRVAVEGPTPKRDEILGIVDREKLARLVQ